MRQICRVRQRAVERISQSRKVQSGRHTQTHLTTRRKRKKEELFEKVQVATQAILKNG
jgi:hypothetical protein